MVRWQWLIDLLVFFGTRVLTAGTKQALRVFQNIDKPSFYSTSIIRPADLISDFLFLRGERSKTEAFDVVKMASILDNGLIKLGIFEILSSKSGIAFQRKLLPPTPLIKASKKRLFLQSEKLYEFLGCTLFYDLSYEIPSSFFSSNCLIHFF